MAEIAAYEPAALLRALGEWAVAMERDEPEPVVEQLAFEASSAFEQAGRALSSTPAA